MALQGQIGLLGDLRHRRRSIMYDLAVLIHTRLLQQIIILHRVIVQHRENQLAPLLGTVDDQRLLKRHGGLTRFMVLNQNAAEQFLVDAQLFQIWRGDSPVCQGVACGQQQYTDRSPKWDQQHKRKKVPLSIQKALPYHSAADTPADAAIAAPVPKRSGSSLLPFLRCGCDQRKLLLKRDRLR